jgi:Fe-S-cluster formation regulator IscX/YfhJ
MDPRLVRIGKMVHGLVDLGEFDDFDLDYCRRMAKEGFAAELESMLERIEKKAYSVVPVLEQRLTPQKGK